MASESELSEREKEILRLVATGVSNKEIAAKLTISPNTVKVHLRSVFSKIGAASRTEAALIAVRMGLVERAQVLPAEGEAGEGIGGEGEAQAAGLDLPVSAPAGAARLRGLPWRRILAGALVLALAAALAGLALTRSGPFAFAPTATLAATRPAVQSSGSSRWSEVSALPQGRSGMGAVVYEGAIYLFGGDTARGVTGTSLRYRPSAGGWEPLAEKPTPVGDVQAVVMGEQIFVPGGRAANGQPVSVLEAYSVRLNRWEARAPLPKALSGYALAAYEGQIFLFGGWTGSAASADVYSYNPAENTWQARTPLPAPRAFAAAAVVEAKIYVIGGFDGGQALRDMTAYFPQRDRSGDTPWEDRAPLPEGRYGMGSTVLANMIYLVGGLTVPPAAADLPPVQYQPLNDRWSSFDRSPGPVGDRPALLALETRLHVLGGKSAGGLLASQQTYQAIYTIALPSVQQ